MKKRQYSTALVLGIFVGLGLFFGRGSEVLTAFLAGCVVSGFIALDWDNVREVACKLATKMHLCSTEMSFWEKAVIAGIKRPLSRVFKEIPNGLKHGTELGLDFFRSLVFAVLLFGLAFEFWYLGYYPMDTLDQGYVWSLVGSLYFVVWVLFISTFSISAIVLIGLVAHFLFLGDYHSDMYDEKLKSDIFYIFLVGWFVDGDNRGVLESSLYMLKVRTKNVIKTWAYVSMLFVWSFVYLANKKTGCCALMTTMLIGIGIAVSETFGLGGLYDVNFQLLLAILMLIGWHVGGYVHKITGALEMKFPRLNFLEHLPA